MFESSEMIALANLSLKRECGGQALLLQVYANPFSVNTRRARRATSALLQS